jgi:2',3'-cyclic-nucleotide 2'-phosphodiesterase (5'-nucleotidase family)
MMKKIKSMLISAVVIISLAFLLVACTAATPTAQELPQVATTHTDEPPTEAPARPTETLPDNLHRITILYTNDEHGYMVGVDEGPGAAEMVGLWKDEFDYSPDGPFLVLSGGDMWTGPAVSTWFEGASMVEVMNAMGYHAAAAGNHEFDFGLDTLAARTGEMSFPLLGANIRYKSDGKVPADVGIQPYTLVEINGVRVGVIGLAYQDTPAVTLPDVVAPFDFIAYEDALREIIPQVRAAGAEIIVVPTHICRSGLNALAVAVSDLGITMFGGGHCHDHFARESRGAVLLGGGGRMASLAYAELIYDDVTDTVALGDYGMMQNRAGNPDATVAAVVDEWVAEAAVTLNQEIGYVNHTISRRSREMNDLIAATWLWRFPEVDVALTNMGGIREGIPEGAITVGTIISVLPFDNTIIQLEMTGVQLENTMINMGDGLAYAGIKNVSGRWVLSGSGEEIDPNMTYAVLVNSFIYAGGSGYRFGEYDPDGYDTSIPYRQPLIDWIEAQVSSASNPIDTAIEALIGGP